ncbi:hypothetical protein HNY73_013519 [Argiope bruennichi]|uniref:CCHC-type domain-containing protein n=1 Tax=Argiope bruennichi TaxID=94029 RepID=A0A8T0EYA0_ARGBR|nr:hypothetical protein HNY73_013519 [Argiope bruennichi]
MNGAENKILPIKTDADISDEIFLDKQLYQNFSMSHYATPSTSPADGSSAPTRSISEANGRRETLGARVYRKNDDHTHDARLDYKRITQPQPTCYSCGLKGHKSTSCTNKERGFSSNSLSSCGQLEVSGRPVVEPLCYSLYSPADGSSVPTRSISEANAEERHWVRECVSFEVEG